MAIQLSQTFNHSESSPFLWGRGRHGQDHLLLSCSHPCSPLPEPRAALFRHSARSHPRPQCLAWTEAALAHRQLTGACQQSPGIMGKHWSQPTGAEFGTCPGSAGKEELFRCSWLPQKEGSTNGDPLTSKARQPGLSQSSDLLIPPL